MRTKSPPRKINNLGSVGTTVTSDSHSIKHMHFGAPDSFWVFAVSAHQKVETAKILIANTGLCIENLRTKSLEGVIHHWPPTCFTRYIFGAGSLIVKTYQNTMEWVLNLSGTSGKFERWTEPFQIEILTLSKILPENPIFLHVSKILG